MAASPKNNLALLFGCQAIFVTGSSLIVSVHALVGLALPVDRRLATIPSGLVFLAAMISTLPASLLMKRIGRRAGFAIGIVAGGFGAVLCSIAVARESFMLFCLGSTLLGLLAGAAQYYRFAAADAVEPGERPRAISLVLAGGLVAAFVGPNLAKWSRTALPGAPFIGTYAALASLQLVALLILAFVDLPKPSAAERMSGGRPLSRVAAQPLYVVAALGSVVAYGTMNGLMTATPLAMGALDFDFGRIASVIQWHAVGMFAPAFFSGRLVQRFGGLRVMAAGAVVLLASAAATLMDTSIWQFWLALAGLGLGWNFLYVAASSLLTDTYSPAEKAKAQGLHDLLVFATITATATTAGALHEVIGWRAMNLAAIGPIVVLLLLIGAVGMRSRGVEPAA
jgi:MFS family permease